MNVSKIDHKTAEIVNSPADSDTYDPSRAVSQMMFVILLISGSSLSANL